ncbi:MAG: glycoside hydrolase, partial [Prevotellaceae bacterium]|nr:glycoside hydrolase [Prevotellaceae bacterium]
MKRLVMAVMLCAFALGGKAQTAVTINPSNRLQTVEGWGVSLCWWAAQAGQWDDAKINEIADWLVSPDGLNYNVFRYNIPGGDDPSNAHCDKHHMQNGKGLRAEMKGFLPIKDDWNYDWDADIAQIKMLRAIVAKAKVYGKEDILKIEAFSNSCPWWMTVSGCVSGSEATKKPFIGSAPEQETNLKSGYYDDFARYLVDVCKHFKEVEGIEFYTLEPFNEPYANNYWKRSGEQEGCFVKPVDQINFIKNYLAPELAQTTLKTVISVSDETNLEISGKVWDAYKNDGTVLNSVVQWNTHTYDGSDSQRTSLRDKVKNGGKRLWMSETGDMSSGASEWTLCKKLFDDMRNLQPVVWCDWQVMEPHPLWSTIQCGGSNNEFDSNNYWRNLNYYVRKQVTSNIKVGYTILSTSNANVLAAVSPNANEVVVCFLNNGSSNATYNLNVPSKSGVVVKKATITTATRSCEGYSISSLSNVSVPKQSVVTVVIDGDFSLKMTDSDGRDLVFGGKYMMSATKKEGTKYPDFYFYASDDNSAVSSKKDFPSVESTGFYAPQYIWEPALVGKDKITLQNMKHGKYLAGNTPDLSATDAEDAMTFLPSGPFTKHNNTPNFWVLEGETGSEYKYLNWSGATEGNGFCYWTAGESDNGSNFRFHKIEYVHINAYVEKNGEKEPVSFKLNNNASLAYTGSAELYHLSIAGTVTAFALNQSVEDVVETKYILNGEEQTSGFDVKNLKNGDVLDVVYVCKNSSFILGDVNADGNVNITDIVAVIAYIRGYTGANFIFEAADVNADGVINITDIVGIIAI